MNDPGPREDLADVVTAHTHGWAVCKADDIEAIPLGWSLSVGPRRRLVLVRGTPEEVVGLLAEAPSGTELRLCGDRAWWHTHLPVGWFHDHEGWYYRRRLDGVPSPAGPVDVRVDGDLVSTEIRVGDRRVASGRAGRWERSLTLDSIVVEEPFRRRGLGRAVVAALCAAGRDLGCDTGVLGSTRAGRPLYESMGFHLLGDQVCAVRREPGSGVPHPR